MAELIDDLSNDPHRGTDLGNGCYKIRLAIASKGRGKSGGARVITHVYVAQESVFLLAIYDKSEQIDISAREIRALLADIE